MPLTSLTSPEGLLYKNFCQRKALIIESPSVKIDVRSRRKLGKYDVLRSRIPVSFESRIFNPWGRAMMLNEQKSIDFTTMRMAAIGP